MRAVVALVVLAAIVPDKLPAALRDEAKEVARAQAIAPGDACVLYEVASLYARAGDRAAALAALRAMAATGAGLDPRARDFGALYEDPEARAIVAAIRKRHPPVVRGRVAFTIAPGGVAPEGVAWSARTHELYLGGVRQIVAVDERGRVSPFARDASFAAVLGLRVDEARGELWAVSSTLGPSRPGAVAGLFRFRLADGALVGKYPLAGRGLNDVVVAADGTVYATATDAGTVVRLDPKSGRFDDVVPPATVPDANGLALSPDGRYLFVASWYAIMRIELATRRTVPLRKADDVADGCNDGLYFAGAHALVGVQNCVHATGRVMRYELAPDLAAITRADVLAAYDPRFDGITTGAIVGDAMLLVANVQLRKHGVDGPTAPLDPYVVERVPITP